MTRILVVDDSAVDRRLVGAVLEQNDEWTIDFAETGREALEKIEENYPDADKKELDAIRHINRTINSKLPILESVRNVTWYPVSFEFEKPAQLCADEGKV